MTRINTVDVKDLADQHLMAEYRELPMVHASLKRSKNSKKGLDLRSIPESYTLNTGHVKFFYNKGRFLERRWNDLIDELLFRGYDIDPDSRTVDWNVFDSKLNNDWTPTPESKKVNAERILERLNQKKDFYRYYKNKIDDSFVEKLSEKYLTKGRVNET